MGVLLLSGNVASNVVIVGTATGPQTTGNIVVGGLIGTDQTGCEHSFYRGSRSGIMITGGCAEQHHRRRPVRGTGNVISGKQVMGSLTWPELTPVRNTTGNIVEGNFIGTDLTGEKALGNGQNGVVIENGAEQHQSAAGPPLVRDNIISGNTFAGVEIEGTTSGAQTSGNMVEFNTIGADKMGLISIANGTGVGIEFARRTTPSAAQTIRKPTSSPATPMMVLTSMAPPPVRRPPAILLKTI